MIEVASRETWQRYIREHIFARAAMTESSFMRDEATIHDMATGYAMDNGHLIATTSFRGWAGGAGAITSTATDVAKWDAALFGDKIISATDLNLMTAPGNFPTSANGARYGFGWVVDTYDGEPRLWHNGGTLGFSADNQIYPRERQSIIVLANLEGGADELANAAFESLHQKLAAAKYRSVGGEDRAITAKAANAWHQIIVGPLERSRFTDDFNKRMLTDRTVLALRKQFSGFGAPCSWVYKGKRTWHNDAIIYTYLVTFTNGRSLNVTMMVDKAGKIAWYFASHD